MAGEHLRGRVPKLLIIFCKIISRVRTWVYQHRNSDNSGDVLASLIVWCLGQQPSYRPYMFSSQQVREHDWSIYNLHETGVQRSPVLGSIVVSIPACHAGDRGSIPRRGVFFFPPPRFFQCNLLFRRVDVCTTAVGKTNGRLFINKLTHWGRGF